MKKCTICKDMFSLDCFNKKISSADGLQDVCRECNRARSRRYYQENKSVHLINIKRRAKQMKESNRQYLFDYFSTHPCIDCGISDIRVLEFDHLGEKDKRKGVGYMASKGYSIDSIIQEIEKCDVRCRNCHQIKTFERLGGTWHDKFLLD